MKPRLKILDFRQSALPLALVLTVSCASSAAGHSKASPTSPPAFASRGTVPARTPSPHAARTSPPGSQSWLQNATLLTIYGRAFATAPILGRLGMDRSFADMARQIGPYWQGIHANNGGKSVRVAVHLIYALASPCSGAGNCLVYLDNTGVDIVRSYIQPAARRGWLVVLDDQLGRSDPATEVQHIIARGYLRYDNVAIALDPEFHTVPGQTTPGVPIGSVGAHQLNYAQYLVDRFAAGQRQLHRKIVIIHQFHEGMIVQRNLLRSDFPHVDTAVIADGFGAPGLKARTYSTLLGPESPGRLRWRGIKLFFPNPNEHAGHGDSPLLTWPQVFGRAPAVDVDRRRYFIRPAPDIVIIA